MTTEIDALAKNGVSHQDDARTAILDRLRGVQIDGPELPEVDLDQMLRFDDPMQAFKDATEFVGGTVHHVGTTEGVATVLNRLDEFRNAKQIASLVPECVEGNFDVTQITDPHHLAEIDWAIIRGRFMVAENGAIWVEGRDLKHRVLPFITQYLAIVVSHTEIVDNMHQAYERLEGKYGTEPGFGLFISGPSKTADIEQSLVIGAHGCRTLQVFVV